MPRRPARRTIGRLLGVALLILGVGRVPLPRAEYHSVGHSDGPNQTCVLHEHLLRWHPTAGPDDLVAVLHWHWFPPRPSHSHDRSHGDDHDGQPPLVLLGDDAVADEAPPGLDLSALPATPDRPVVAPAAGLIDLLAAVVALDDRPPRPPGAIGTYRDAPPARRAARIALLQRWTC